MGKKMNQERGGFSLELGYIRLDTPECRTKRNAVYFDAVISFRDALESFELRSTEAERLTR